MTTKISTLNPFNINTIGNGPCGICLVLKDRDESRISTITRIADIDLRMPLAPNERWVGHLNLFYTGATGGDLRIHFDVPSGATGTWAIMGLFAGVTTFTGDMTSIGKNSFGSGNNLAFGAGGGTDPNNGLITFVIQNGSNAGNLSLFWAQRVSSVTATIIRANSFMVANLL